VQHKCHVTPAILSRDSDARQSRSMRLHSRTLRLWRSVIRIAGSHVCLSHATSKSQRLCRVSESRVKVAWQNRRCDMALKRGLFKLLRGWFWGFTPRRGDTLHRGELIWHGGGDHGPLVPSSVPNFTPVSATIRVQNPKTEFLLIFLTKIWNSNVPQGRIPCASFTNFAKFVTSFRMR